MKDRDIFVPKKVDFGTFLSRCFGGEMVIRNLQLINDDGEKVKEFNSHFTESMNEEGYRFPSHKAGARLFRDVKMPEGITYQDKGRLYDLSQLMVGNTNLIGYREHGRIKGYSDSEIGGIVSLSGKRTKEFIKRMVQKNILRKLDAGYYVNPAYFMSTGQRLSLELFIHFQDALTPILPKWAVNHFLAQAKKKKE